MNKGSDSKVEVRRIDCGSPEFALETKLRSRVLREPLGLRFTPEELSKEPNDIHVGAFSVDQLLGCLILTPVSDRVVKMRQVAVRPDAQGLGIGKRMVAYSEAISVRLGFLSIELNARETAVQFYLAQGYEIFGEPFEEVTLPHRKMRKKLV